MLSKHNPRLQIRHNSGSLAALLTCPRKYQMQVLDGWRPAARSADMDFGSMLQEAQDCFLRARLGGATKEDATLEAVARALQISGQWLEGPLGYEWQPWGGRYQTLWRCTGTEPYRRPGSTNKSLNDRLGRRKCPHSHKDKWFSEPEIDGLGVPVTCPVCDSVTEEAVHYIPSHPTKNRVTLLRMVVWLCDSQAEADGIQPVRLPSGVDAVELEVVVPLGRKVPARCPYPDECRLVRRCLGDCVAEDYELVCHWDELVEYRGRRYVLDNKTTSQSVDPNLKSGAAWWSQWRQNLQMKLYDLVGNLTGLAVGCAVRGVQVTREGGDIGVQLITKTEAQREEFLASLHYWLSQAETWATTGYYPMNDAACRGCPFIGICDMDPAFREATLRADFVQQRDERLFEKDEA